MLGHFSRALCYPSDCSRRVPLPMGSQARTVDGTAPREARPALGWEDPWRKAWQPAPGFRPGESHVKHVQPLGWEDPWRKAWQLAPGFRPGESQVFAKSWT